MCLDETYLLYIYIMLNLDVLTVIIISTTPPSPSFIQPDLYEENILLCFVSVSESSITNSSEVESLAIQPHKLLILDARSYAAAVANRAKGGGCECPGRCSQLLSCPGYR